MLPSIMLAAITPFLPTGVELDFSTVTTGQSYRIDIVVKDATGNVLVSGPIKIGVEADTEDVRDAINDALGESGLEVVSRGSDRLRLASKGETKLGTIAYDTYVKGLPAPKLAGPKVLSRVGISRLIVNGLQF